MVDPIESFYGGGDSSHSVPGMEHDTGREIEPIPTETLQRLRAPIASEIMLLEKLNQVECKNTDGKVETVGRELPAQKVIHVVVTLQLAYHPFHLSALVVEVNDSIFVSLFLWNIGGDDPVMVFSIEYVGLLSSFSPFHDEPESILPLVQRVYYLGNIVVGITPVLVFPPFPPVFADSFDVFHDRLVVVCRDSEI